MSLAFSVKMKLERDAREMLCIAIWVLSCVGKHKKGLEEPCSDCYVRTSSEPFAPEVH